MITFNIHCPVLDLPAPVDVVDVVGKRVGDLGIDLEPLDVVKEGKELSLMTGLRESRPSFLCSLDLAW